MKEKLLSLYQDLHNFEKNQIKMSGIKRLLIIAALLEISPAIFSGSILFIPFSWMERLFKMYDMFFILSITAICIAYFCLAMAISTKLKTKISLIEPQIIKSLSIFLQNEQYDETLKTFSLIDLINRVHRIKQMNSQNLTVNEVNHLLNLINNDEQRKQAFINEMSDRFFYSGIKVVSEDVSYDKTLPLLEKTQKELKSIAKNEMTEFVNRLKKVNKQEQEKILAMIPMDQATFSYPL